MKLIFLFVGTECIFGLTLHQSHFIFLSIIFSPVFSPLFFCSYSSYSFVVHQDPKKKIHPLNYFANKIKSYEANSSEIKLRSNTLIGTDISKKTRRVLLCGTSGYRNHRIMCTCRMFMCIYIYTERERNTVMFGICRVT